MGGKSKLAKAQSQANAIAEKGLKQQAKAAKAATRTANRIATQAARQDQQIAADQSNALIVAQNDAAAALKDIDQGNIRTEYINDDEMMRQKAGKRKNAYTFAKSSFATPTVAAPTVAAPAVAAPAVARPRDIAAPTVATPTVAAPKDIVKNTKAVESIKKVNKAPQQMVGRGYTVKKPSVVAPQQSQGNAKAQSTTKVNKMPQQSQGNAKAQSTTKVNKMPQQMVGRGYTKPLLPLGKKR